MLKFLVFAMVLGAVAGCIAQEDKTERMKWFKEARFGLFIHWGLYAIPAGKWGDRNSHGEWIRTTAQIPVAEYDKFQPQFNPTKFNADEWMAYAQEAGMKYVTITTKHHDGFALFDSKLTDWDVMGAPFKRDIMKELASAARKKGIVPCWYHSIMDWKHPDYLPHREWEKGLPVGDMDRYEQFLRGQVTELLTNYGPIGTMWFDGEWESTWNHERGQRLYDLCRSLQPNVIVNNRVDVGRDGMAGMTKGAFAGDFGTPEQEVPAEGLPGSYWESCITMNSHWGWNAYDTKWKSTEELLGLLVEIVSKGGNFLLNVGPKADGTFPQEAIDRLKGMGAWMKVNGEAIYGTDANPFGAREGWRATRKGNTLYIFNEEHAPTRRIPGVGIDPSSVSLLGGGKIEWRRDGSDLILTLPETKQTIPVVKMEFASAPPIYREPILNSETDQFVKSLKLEVGPMIEGVEWRYTLDGEVPTATSPTASTITLTETASVSVRGFVGSKAVTSTTSRPFTKVVPLPASQPEWTDFKVSVGYGEFEKCDDLAKGTLAPLANQKALSLGEFEKRENVGLIYEGWIDIPQSEMVRFSLTSDDGARLFVDGKLVVNNDGLHSPVEKFGSQGLEKGSHRVRVEWFNRTGGATLMVGYALPGGDWNRL